MKENESNRKRIQEAIIRLTTWIKAESEAREVFNKSLLSKYNDMESELISIREESKKLILKIFKQLGKSSKNHTPIIPKKSTFLKLK